MARPTEQAVWAPWGGGLREACLGPPDWPSSQDSEAPALVVLKSLKFPASGAADYA